MSDELPQGWAIATLGEICSKPQYGWTCRAAKEGAIKYLRTTDISGGRIDWDTVPFCEEVPDDTGKYRVQSNDILVSRAGSVGVSYLISDVPCDAVFASYLIRFKPLVDIQPQWVGMFLKSDSYWRSISEFSAGIAVPNVNASKLASLEVPIAPLPEQRRIVAKLEKLLAKVDACQQRLAKIPVLLKRFRQSVLAAACSGRLTADWREENPNEEHLDEAAQRLPKPQADNDTVDAPESWIRTCLDSICTKITDGEHLTPPLSEQGVPLLSAKDVRDTVLDFSDTKFVTEQVAERSRARCNPEKGDILVVSRGATVGRTCRVKIDDVFCLMGSVLLFKPDPAFVVPQLIEFCFKSPLGLAALVGRSGSTAQQAIYIKDMRAFVISIAPLPEQYEIVRRVEALFALANQIEARFKKAQAHVDKLTPSLLARAFRGELVPQDPNDEPAENLLARIQGSKQEYP